MPRILIFDSGLGGLSIYQAIKLLLPGTQLNYLADIAGYPYGEKSSHWLEDRCCQVLTALLEQQSADIIVIACNTASTLSLPRLRVKFNLPIVGVVPAIKPAAALTQNNAIGLLATPATIDRPYTNQLIEEFATNKAVFKLGSTDLVQLTEDKLRGKTVPLEKLKHILDSWFISLPQLPSCVVLGCTHFPLLKPELVSLWPQILWLDSGEAIARRVAHLVIEGGLSSPADLQRPNSSATKFWSTAPSDEALVGIIEAEFSHHCLLDVGPS